MPCSSLYRTFSTGISWHAQADLSLHWAHSHFVGFVMRRLILILIGYRYFMMPFDFSEKKVLATSAGSDNGRQLTRAIANAGGLVCALGRRNNVEELAKKMVIYTQLLFI